MQRAQVTAQSAQFRAPVAAGYAGAGRLSLQAGAIPADEWMYPPADAAPDEVKAARVDDALRTDLLAVFIERTSGAPIERFHVAMYFVAFFALLAATLMYQGTASASSFHLFFAAGVASIGLAAGTFVGVRAWLVGQLREVAADLGMSDEQARRSAREALRRVTAPFQRP